jgi:hypothetical protein
MRVLNKSYYKEKGFSFTLTLLNPNLPVPVITSKTNKHRIQIFQQENRVRVQYLICMILPQILVDRQSFVGNRKPTSDRVIELSK